jgi:antitoxin component YwqK of YwqJK toxin-antitoxin module
MNTALDRSLALPSPLIKTTTRLASLLAAAVLLTGCGDTVLDFRNADVSNGKIYKAGADAAFTGTVTNIPQDKILQQQPGLFMVNRILQGAVTSGGGDTKRFFMDPSLCNAKLKKGVLDGEVVCKLAQGGVLHSRVAFKDGSLHGAYTRYDLTPANHVFVTATFENGQPEGQQEIFSLQTQKLTNRLPWKAGKLEGEEQSFHPESGVLAGSYHYKNGKLDGPAMRWGADGKMVTYRATLVEGNQDGVEEEFYPDTGKPARRTEWSRGKKNGRQQAWDAQGNVTQDVVYSEDVLQQPKVAPAAVEPETASPSAGS